MIQKALNAFPYALLVLLVSALLLILHLKYYSGLFVVIFALLGIILYILLNSRNLSAIPIDNENQIVAQTPVLKLASSSFLVLISAFLIVFSLSLLSLINEFYSKGIGYYILIAVCSGILILEIFTYQSEIQGYCILLEATFLSFNILFSNHLVFPHGIALPDMGLHFSTFVTAILTTGHISTSTIGYYNVFAVHHVLAAMCIQLTGFDPLTTYLGLGSFLVAVGVLFVFILGKRFISFQFGLITAVLFCCLDYYLMYGEHPEHQAYNFGIALICFTILLYTYKFQKPAFYVLFLVSAIAMVFTHHLSAAIVFVAAGSLGILDLVRFLLTKKFTFPSKYIILVFGVILFVGLNMGMSGSATTYGVTMVESYGGSMYSFATNLISTPPTVTVTPVPEIQVTSTITPSLSGGPLTPTTSPTHIIPTQSPVSVPTQSPVSVPTQVTVPPTAYDKLSLTELFKNTLGSALLVFVAVLGCCAFLQKRSRSGSFIILNSIIISCFLGLGILFSYVLLLPDRIYPFLQIFCLIFLGASGLLWLATAFPSKNKTVVVGGICILVALMSFFSLASIINGFETSPFVGDTLAYPKLYTTGQDVAFSSWHSSFLQGGNIKIEVVSINAVGMIQSGSKSNDVYQVFDRSLLKTGILVSGDKFGQHSFIRLHEQQVAVPRTFSSYYDNGLISMMKVNPAAQ